MRSFASSVDYAYVSCRNVGVPTILSTMLACLRSYNRINDGWSCENNETLATDLKIRLNPDNKRFWVMSDWILGTRSASINEGQ